MQRSTLVVLALLTLSDGGTARAGGFHVTVFGVRRTGMGTNLANPDDVTALFANPAGLADLPGMQLQLSAGMTFIDSSTSLQALDPGRFPAVNPPGCDPNCPWPVGPDGYYQTNIKPTSYLGIVPFLGASYNLGRVSPRLKGLTVSLALYSPGAYGATLPSGAPSAYFVTSGLFLMAAATGGVGWRINKYLSVGANVSYNYMRLSYGQKFSTIDALTPIGQAPSDMTRLAQILLGDLQVDYTGTDSGVGWTLGAIASPTDWLSLAFVYAGWTTPHFDGPVTIIGLDTAQQTPEEVTALAGKFGYKLPTRLIVQMPIPPTVQWGVNLKPRDWIEVGLDARLWLYHLFDQQKITPIYEPGPGTEPLTEAGLSKPKHYSDSWQLCLGLLLRPLERHRSLELMGGVGFDKSPVPDETFSLDSPSLDQIFGSLGVREVVKEHFRIGASYVFTYYMPRNITNSQTWPPTNARVSGMSHLPTVEVTYRY
jgi:long-subunit fatty acid transport protein